MKKTIGFILFGLLFGIANLDGQNIPTYPIPSYNISVDGYANFLNQHSNSKNTSRGKRDANIHLKSGSVGNPNCEATVWVYSLDQTTILGPYTVNCGETLTVEIDEREWGVLVESEEEVIVDVWYS
ncbi:MAG: hypothetical protein WCL00_02710, partial [Bacteroidota bacterium]